MAITRLAQFGIGVTAYPAFLPKAEAVAPPADVAGGGSSKRRARKGTIRPVSEAEREDLLSKFRIVPPLVVPEPVPFSVEEFYEDEDDEILIMALTRVLH